MWAKIKQIKVLPYTALYRKYSTAYREYTMVGHIHNILNCQNEVFVSQKYLKHCHKCNMEK